MQSTDKKRLALMVLVISLVALCVTLFGYMVIKQQDYSINNIIWMALPLILIIFMAVFLLKRYKEAGQGIPSEDERSRSIKQKAANNSFYVTMYWLLAISIFEKYFAMMFHQQTLTASQVVGGGIFGMVISFLVFWFYLGRKGEKRLN